MHSMRPPRNSKYGGWRAGHTGGLTQQQQKQEQAMQKLGMVIGS